PSEPDRLFEDVVDPRLLAGPLRLEAFDHFRAEADRNRNLLRCGLWAARFGERLQHLFGQDLMRGSGALKIGLGPFGVVSVERDFHAFCRYRLRWPNTRSPRRALAIRSRDVYITSSSADAPAGTRFGVFGAMPLATPHYLIDEAALDRNLARVDRLRAASGAK